VQRALCECVRARQDKKALEPPSCGISKRFFVGQIPDPRSKTSHPRLRTVHTQLSRKSGPVRHPTSSTQTQTHTPYQTQPMAAATTSPSMIPRFLLPRSGLLWRGGPSSKALRNINVNNNGNGIRIRFASSSSSSSSSSSNPTVTSSSSSTSTKPKPRVLEKPERFNPPSHGAQLPRKNGMPRHYGGDLSKEEVLTQIRKEYPGLMAPSGSLAYRVIYSKWVHLTITIVSSFISQSSPHHPPHPHFIPRIKIKNANIKNQSREH